MDAGLKNIKAGKRENITMGLGPGRFGLSSWEEVKVWLHIHIFGANDKENVKRSLTQIRYWEAWEGTQI